MKNRTRTKKVPTTFRRGDRVRIVDHAGCEDSTGRVTGAPERILGHWYWNVRMTGGRGAGWSIRFLASQMEKN